MLIYGEYKRSNNNLTEYRKNCQYIATTKTISDNENIIAISLIFSFDFVR